MHSAITLFCTLLIMVPAEDLKVVQAPSGVKNMTNTLTITFNKPISLGDDPQIYFVTDRHLQNELAMKKQFPFNGSKFAGYNFYSEGVDWLENPYPLQLKQASEVTAKGAKLTITPPRDFFCLRADEPYSVYVRPDSLFATEGRQEFTGKVCRIRTEKFLTNHHPQKTSALSDFPPTEEYKKLKIFFRHERDEIGFKPGQHRFSGQGINVAIVDRGIPQDAFAYQSVVYSNLTLPTTKHATLGTHGLKMGMYLLYFAPRANIWDVTNTYSPQLYKHQYQDYFPEVDIVSRSGGAGGQERDVFLRYVKAGKLVLQSVGNRSKALPQPAGDIPLKNDLTQFDGAYLHVQAVVISRHPLAKETFRCLRSYPGQQRAAYTITMVENGRGATSQATAHMAGIMANLMEANRYYKREFTSQQLAAIVLQTAKDIGKPVVDPIFGHGLVQYEAALEMIAQGKEPTYELYAKPR